MTTVQPKYIKYPGKCLIDATRNNDVKVLEVLLDTHDVSQDTKNDLLMRASEMGHLEAVKILLHHGADINNITINGTTPLMKAAADGRITVIKYLIEKKANILYMNDLKHSALSRAALDGQLNAVNVLLMNLKKNKLPEGYMKNALLYANLKKHQDIISALENFSGELSSKKSKSSSSGSGNKEKRGGRRHTQKSKRKHRKTQKK